MPFDKQARSFFFLSVSIALLRNDLTSVPVFLVHQAPLLPFSFSFSIIKMDFLKPPFILLTAPLSIAAEPPSLARVDGGWAEVGGGGGGLLQVWRSMHSWSP